MTENNIKCLAKLFEEEFQCRVDGKSFFVLYKDKLYSYSHPEAWSDSYGNHETRVISHFFQMTQGEWMAHEVDPPFKKAILKRLYLK